RGHESRWSDAAYAPARGHNRIARAARRNARRIGVAAGNQTKDRKSKSGTSKAAAAGGAPETVARPDDELCLSAVLFQPLVTTTRSKDHGGDLMIVQHDTKNKGGKP